MPTPPYITKLRLAYGSGPLLLPGVCGVVLRDDPATGRQQLLLGRRSDTGRWALPAGIVEPGEQPATTLVRELWEETRVVVTVERLAWVVAQPELVYPNGDRCQFITSVFRCRYVSGEAAVGDEESSAVDWFDLDALPELQTKERDAIDTALSERQECRFEV
ncbi:NUDIX domain-containing protein [uncultured Friedmanniella sp.]|uniref:NUDIX hydrolase n=1 Tax=uncultured Friedmanniella sp. TaxID=335381 RepID=UPI0035CBAB7E